MEKIENLVEKLERLESGTETLLRFHGTLAIVSEQDGPVKRKNQEVLNYKGHFYISMIDNGFYSIKDDTVDSRFRKSFQKLDEKSEWKCMDDYAMMPIKDHGKNAEARIYLRDV